MNIAPTSARNLLPLDDGAEPAPAADPAAHAAPVAAAAARASLGPIGDPLLERFHARGEADLRAIPGMDAAGASALVAARAAGRIDHWGDVERTLAAAGTPDVAGVMKGIYRLEAQEHVRAQGLQRGSSVLFLASMPGNAPPLDLAGERDLVAGGAKGVVAIHDPTLGEIEALASTGAFRAVWASGHGVKGQLVLSDDAGNLEKVSAEAFAAAVTSSPEVKFVLASVCSGAAGDASSVIRAVAAHGPAAAGYAGPVNDADALRMSGAVARALGAGVPFRAAVAAAYYTVYPHDGMPGGPRPIRPAGGPRPEWVPFVQFAPGTPEAAGGGAPSAPTAAPPPA